LEILYLIAVGRRSVEIVAGIQNPHDHETVA
jgi:hypothetical protein